MMNTLLTMAAGIVPSETAAPDPGSKAQAPLRVLLVEDNAELRACIQEAMALWGLEVDSYSDGLKAVDAAYRRRFDVLLTDLRLPGMGGIGVIRSIRAFRPSLPVLVMTAYPDWKVADEAKAAGAAFVLHKPLNLRELIELVRELGGTSAG